MVSQTARQRLDTISAHFAAQLLTEDLAPATTNLFPLSCSSNLSTQFRRLDNRLHYGRQSSAAQGFFMNQAHTPPFNHSNCSSSNLSTPFKRLDNRIHYGRQSSASQGYFMRQAVRPTVEQTANSDPTHASSKTCISDEKSSVNPTPPLFSRLGSGEPQFAKPRPEFYSYAKTSPEFARPTPESAEKTLTSQKPILSSQTNGVEWSPRINVAESKCSYVITVELPGIDVTDIRVEMDDKNLIVRGKRSAKWWNATGCLNDSGMTYHKREISQGQYQVVWPLPSAANKDYISAEFMEGILQITIPKL